MAYDPPVYPTTVPTAEDLPTRVDDVDWLYAARINELALEIRAIAAELGALPKGTAADVAARLNLLALKASPVFTTKITTPIIDLTSGQIVFPSTAVPSANANTLDDYEDGTWAPEITFGGGDIGVTYSKQLGRYQKIGNKVWVHFDMRLSSKGSSAGIIKVANLPFVATLYGGGAMVYNTGEASITQLYGIGTDSAATAGLYKVTLGVMGVAYNTDLTDSSILIGYITYRV